MDVTGPTEIGLMALGAGGRLGNRVSAMCQKVAAFVAVCRWVVVDSWVHYFPVAVEALTRELLVPI